MGEKPSEDTSQTEEIDSSESPKGEEIVPVEEWEIVEETTSEEKAHPEVLTSTKSSTAPPQTVITKPKKDRNKCPYCDSIDVYLDTTETTYWCANCKRVYQFEQDE